MAVSLDETDYVYIVYGVHEREQEGDNRTLTYEYALLEFTYTAPSDEPTEAYTAWIGTWSVDDGTNTDTWTITADKNNETYKISGLVGKTSSTFVVAGFLNNYRRIADYIKTCHKVFYLIGTTIFNPRIPPLCCRFTSNSSFSCARTRNIT